MDRLQLVQRHTPRQWRDASLCFGRLTTLALRRPAA
jgi:hypothetical protein